MCTKNLDDMIYSSWDIECDRLKMVIMGYCCPFPPTPPHPTKSSKLKKSKISQEPYSDTSYDCGFWYTKTTITLDMVPEIRNKTDITFCHFGPFFSLLVSLHPGKSNFWKNKKASGDVIILHLFTKNHDHMICAS